MGTRDKPGPFDCWATLEPNEPHFVLKGSDELAAPLVYLWALARENRIKSVDFRQALDDLEKAAMTKGPHNPDKVLEAKVCALRMRHYACDYNGGHERLDTGTMRERAKGFRPAHCFKCGMDMTVDSSG